MCSFRNNSSWAYCKRIFRIWLISAVVWNLKCSLSSMPLIHFIQFSFSLAKVRFNLNDLILSYIIDSGPLQYSEWFVRFWKPAKLLSYMPRSIQWLHNANLWYLKFLRFSFTRCAVEKTKFVVSFFNHLITIFESNQKRKEFTSSLTSSQVMFFILAATGSAWPQVLPVTVT